MSTLERGGRAERRRWAFFNSLYRLDIWIVIAGGQKESGSSTPTAEIECNATTKSGGNTPSSLSHLRPQKMGQ